MSSFGARGLPADFDSLTRHDRALVKEALARGIAVEIVDAGKGLIAFECDSARITLRNALSDRTSAVAMSICADKMLTRQVLARAGLRVPKQHLCCGGWHDRAFLDETGRVVIKPLAGEMGAGVAVNVTSAQVMREAIDSARRYCRDVLMEEYCEGEDVRVLVIDGVVAAAAVRRPPMICGDGVRTIAQLIRARNHELSGQTAGESRIPLDGEAERCLRESGLHLAAVLPEGRQVAVRRTCNFHTGGTLEDITPVLHPDVAAVAIEAARIIDLPVAGVDLVMPSIEGRDYRIIEVNENPGLGNHDPQRPIERFFDYLFPRTTH